MVTGGVDKVFCAGANIQMLATSSHGHKVNFCKFTNETRNGIEDAIGQLAAGVDRGGERHRRWGRLRARPRLRRDPADRRSGVGRLAARGSPARGAPGHRRADPGRRQAVRPPRPRRRVRHPHRGDQGPAGRRLGARRRDRPQEQLRRAGRHSRRGAGGRLPTGRPLADGIELPPLGVVDGDRRRHAAVDVRRRRHRPRARVRPTHRSRARTIAARRPATNSRPPAAGAWIAAGRARARPRDPPSAVQRTTDRHVGPDDESAASKRSARPRTLFGNDSGPLARPRGPAVLDAHAEAARCVARAPSSR